MDRQDVVEYHSYLQSQPAQEEWIVPHLIPKTGLMVMAGQSQEGKSYLMLQLAVALTHGNPFLGVPANGPQRVLYLQFDCDATEWDGRLRHALERNWFRAPQPGYFFTNNLLSGPRTLDIMNEDDRIWIEGILEDIQPQVVILDVLREIHSQEETDFGLKEPLSHLKRLFAHQVLFLIHHVKKDIGKATDRDGNPLPINPIEVLRGSGALPAAARGIWVLHQDRLIMAGRTIAKQSFHLPRFHAFRYWEEGLQGKNLRLEEQAELQWEDYLR